MKIQSLVAGLALLATVVSVAEAGPILKPRKYYGPIPQSSISVRVGFLGGATNDEMYQFLDGQRFQAEMAVTEDFGNGLAFEAAYMYKPHPQFGVRLNGSVSFLRSSGTGTFTGSAIILPDTILPSPLVAYNRDFDVTLVAMEASGVYYFTDAAVKEFQPYIGGGFTFGVPFASFKEDRVDAENGAVYPGIDTTKRSFEAGVHAVLGAFYYITNRFAVTAEGRYQLLESKYPLLTPNEDGDLEEVTFIVDYSGFYLALGVTRGF